MFPIFPPLQGTFVTCLMKPHEFIKKTDGFFLFVFIVVVCLFVLDEVGTDAKLTIVVGGSLGIWSFYLFIGIFDICFLSRPYRCMVCIVLSLLLERRSFSIMINHAAISNDYNLGAQGLTPNFW
eukprot:TRINITY_DN880_c0_g1_i2.p1 TRINITY_DN880_c0_g1~~TRINITY_DN880_c0_g1_i2.p1  ORF type:complete len:124 (+),score=13.31 TRINITY_DN880_c0_g1_i2:1970-2341(+)